MITKSQVPLRSTLQPSTVRLATACPTAAAFLPSFLQPPTHASRKAAAFPSCRPSCHQSHGAAHREAPGATVGCLPTPPMHVPVPALIFRPAARRAPPYTTPCHPCLLLCLHRMSTFGHPRTAGRARRPPLPYRCPHCASAKRCTPPPRQNCGMVGGRTVGRGGSASPVAWNLSHKPAPHPL